VVTGDSAAPPFCFIDEEGNPAGFNVDIFNAIAEITGLSATITLAPWMEAMSMMEDGRADVLLGMYVSKRRGKLFDFSYPFITGMHLLYVRRGVDIGDMNDLAGKTVVVSRGDIMYDYVMEHDTGATIIYGNSHKECLRMLAEGGCDCYLSVLLLGYPYDLGYDHDKIIAVGDPSVSLDYCFAVKKGDAGLVALINEGLAAINENGTFGDIYGKWFQDIKPHNIRVVAKYVVIVLAPIILFLVLLGIWNWSLRRRVARQTVSLRHELSERRETEEALRTEHDNLKNILDTMDDGVYIVNREYDIEYLNPKILNEFGPYNGVKCFQYFHGLDDPCPWCKIKDVSMGKSVHWEWSSFINRKTYDLIGTHLKNRDGSISHLNIFRDISGRKRAEEERLRLMTAIEQVAEAVVITDAEATIQYVNPAFTRITGYPREEAVGSNPRILKSGRQDDVFYREMWDILAQGGVWKSRFINKRKDDTLYTEDATISSVKDSSGKIVNYIAVKRDITQELHLEEQLRQAQKMESVGRLAGGIAHDFNNILTVITGNVELIFMSISPDDPVYDDLKEIKSSADRAAGLTRQLLAFSRRQIIEPKVINMNDLILGMDRLLRRIIGEDVEFITVPQEGLWPVYVDPGQMEQVLTNLVVNARDAMPTGGKLTIETANVLLNEEYAGDHRGASPGEYVMLAVSDTGMGMDQETVSHIFEPFFTTKETGKGTGLGLSTCYGIVKQNKGSIWVYSEPGNGTTMKVYLPRVQRDRWENKSTESLEAPAKGTETVLVVEDEPSVLKMIVRTLNKQGYTTLEASNGEEAVRAMTSHEGEIHLLITDVIMPRMGGKLLSGFVKKGYPGIKTLFMSGYTDNSIVNHGVLDPGLSFIQKPFSPIEILKKVRQVLDE